MCGCYKELSESKETKKKTISEQDSILSKHCAKSSMYYNTEVN